MPSPVVQNPFKEALKEDNKLIFSQESFDGGMNQQVDPTRLQNNEYPLLVNGRTRYGVVEPVKLPENADPQGTLDGMLIQGIYAAGPFLLFFANGKTATLMGARDGLSFRMTRTSPLSFVFSV